MRQALSPFRMREQPFQQNLRRSDLQMLRRVVRVGLAPFKVTCASLLWAVRQHVLTRRVPLQMRTSDCD